MALSIVRLYMLALGIAHVVTGQLVSNHLLIQTTMASMTTNANSPPPPHQLFPGEPACAVSIQRTHWRHCIKDNQLTGPRYPKKKETCYQGAIATNNCKPADLACQCSPAGRAAVSLLGGTCLLTSCSVNDISSFTTAYSAACAASVNQESTPTAATSQDDDTAQQQQQQQQQPEPAGLSTAAIAGVAAASASVVLVAGAVVCFLVVRRRRQRQRWAQMERDKAAGRQTSLEEELQRGTRSSDAARGSRCCMVEDDIEAAAASSSSSRPGSFAKKRNMSAVGAEDGGPQELMAVERACYELPGSLAGGEKM